MKAIMDTNTTEIIHKLDDLRKDMDGQFAALPTLYATKDSVASVTKELGKKVNMTWFIGTQIVLLVFIASTLASMYAAIQTIQDVTQETRETVANINGKLEPFDFVIEN